MGKTKIEWTERTWSPATGCTHAGSPGCDHCYARRMARRLAGRYGYPAYPRHFDVTLHPERLEQPLHWRKHRTVFVCSMSDLFHEDVPDDFICDVFYTMYQSPQYTFQLLTKRPQRMLNWFNRPDAHKPLPNIWLGVSVENQETADERIPQLLQTPAAVRFVSVEPMLGSIDLTMLEQPSGDQINGLYGWRKAHTMERVYGLDWVICGGESGPGARPMHPDWARSLRDQCQAAGTPFFFKSWGAWAERAGSDDPDGHGHPLWPDGRFIGPDDWKAGPEMRGAALMYHVGKRAAGRLLDGREWNQMPEVRR